MTKEQQKIIDGFHERVISLIMKRRREMRYSANPQLTFEAITAEIDKVEKERREYERNAIASRQEKSAERRGLSEAEAGTERNEVETDVRLEN